MRRLLAWLVATAPGLLSATAAQPLWAQTKPPTDSPDGSAAVQRPAQPEAVRERPDLALSFADPANPSTSIEVDNGTFGTWLLRIRGPLRAEEFIHAMRVSQQAQAEGVLVSDAEAQALVDAEIGSRVDKAFRGNKQNWLAELQQAGVTERGFRLSRSLEIGEDLLARRVTAKHWQPDPQRVRTLWELKYGPEGRGMRLRALFRRVVNEFDLGTMDREAYHRRGLELLEDARAEVSGLRDRAMAGESFAGLASRLSDDVESQAQGGLLKSEFWSPQGWPADVRTSLVALKVGEISPPLEARGGIWIFKLEGVVETPFESVSDALNQEMVANGPESDEVDAYVQGLVATMPAKTLPALETPDLSTPEGRATVVLEVGDRKVTAAEYEAWLRADEGELMAMRLGLLEVIAQYGREHKITLTPDQIEQRIDMDLEEIIKTGYKGRRELWLAELAQRNRTVDSWRREAADRARMDLVLERLLYTDPAWVEARLRAMWAERYGADGVIVDARELVKTIPVEPRGEDEPERLYNGRVSTAGIPIAEALQLIAERIRDGEDFGALAKKESDDPESALLGGVPPGGFDFLKFDEQIRSALMNAKLGDLVGPYQSGERIYLFEVLAKREVPFEAEREGLLAELLASRQPQIELSMVKNRAFQPDQVRFEAGLYR